MAQAGATEGYRWGHSELGTSCLGPTGMFGVVSAVMGWSTGHFGLCWCFFL